MKKLIGIILLVSTLIALFRFREGILNLLSWFGSLEAITRSMENAGVWGPIVYLSCLSCRSSLRSSQAKP